MKNVLLIIGIGCVLSTSACAQDFRLPIGHADELRQYALAQGRRGVREISVSSLDPSYPNVTRTNVVGAFTEDILDKLLAAELPYRLTNPDDLVTGHIYIYDEFDCLLFYGSAEYIASSIKKNPPVYSLWMMNVPILANVRAAEILAKSADGRTARHINVEIDRQGRAIFDPRMTGASNGTLVVVFNDGTTMTYDLSNPIAETPEVSTERAQYKINGHYVVTGVSCPLGENCTQISPIVVKITELFERPSVLLRIPDNPAPQEVLFDVSGYVQANGGYWVRPTALVYTVDGKDSDPIPFDEFNPTILQFYPGDWRIRFIWNEFGLPGLIYTGPENSNG